MSAGAFELAKYETNRLQITPVRVQPETETLTLNGVINTAPAGSRTPGIPIAKVSGSRRTYGTHARMVTVRFLTAPTAGGYAAGGIVSLPVLQRANWDLYDIGQEGTYLGGTIRFVGKRAEVIK